MRKVQRSELMDYQTYGERRAQVQEKMFEVKRPRRVHLGEHLTFLFENHDTMWYQIQEMMRAEQLVKEDAIAHELETYNGLLGGDGVLACSLLIEIDDREVRAERLRSCCLSLNTSTWSCQTGKRSTRSLTAGRSARIGSAPCNTFSSIPVAWCRSRSGATSSSIASGSS